jgi:diguanylate cyclase (GGDEF)-like protein/PAS domain S-box-containing protein
MTFADGDSHMAARIILVADDHEMVRRGIRSLLESRGGMEVWEACDGREAVEKAADLKPHLVILDVSMPLLDGLSAAREIKKVAPRTAILILTFQATETLRNEANSIGVNECLTKGEDGDALMRAIDAAMSSQSGLESDSEGPNSSSTANSPQNQNTRENEDFPLSHSKSMRKPLLRVLFLHSRIACIERCLQELKDVQFEIESDIVLTSEQCSQRLRSKHYDIVLAEYPIPKRQRTPTTDLLRRTHRHIPLIFVTDRMEREALADLITRGAADCVEIDNLGHLPIAIRRALKENTLRGERKRIEEKLQHSEAHYRALMGNLAFGICRCGMEGQFVDVNQALVTMLGYTSQKELLAGNLAVDILRDSSKRAQLLGEVNEKGRIDPLEIDWNRKDGTSLKVRLSGREVYTDEGKRDGYELIVEDVTEQRELEAHLRQQADKDPLTGLANYRHLVGVLESEIRRSKRTGREFALLLFDLDRLKAINDRYGHVTGSQALCRLAEALTTGCRNVDTAARFGGDEFAMVLPETGVESARLVAQRLCDSLANDGKTPKLSVSVGVAIYPTDGEAIETLLIAADMALYGMKARVHGSTRMIQ